MVKRVISSLMMTFFIITPTISHATDIVRLEQSGTPFNYHLPDSYCDITNTINGITFKSVIESINDPSLPNLKIIISPCNNDAGDGPYPWGWVGLVKNVPIEQEMLNNVVVSLLGDQDLMTKLNEKAQGLAGEVLEDKLGLSGDVTVGKQEIIWADENSILIKVHTATQVQGLEIQEVVLTSTTVINEIYATTILYNLAGKEPSIEELATLLINNARHIKDAN